MKQISVEQLQANHFYWARRKLTRVAPASEAFDLEIIKISTMFGTSPEFWTVAITGSDEYFDLDAFEYFHKVAAPSMAADQRPALTLVNAAARSVGH